MKSMKEIYDLIDGLNEVAKHKKRSNKTRKKSKHKHDYSDVLLNIEKKSKYSFLILGKKCKICGHIRDADVTSTLTLSREEILKKYSHLEIIDYEF